MTATLHRQAQRAALWLLYAMDVSGGTAEDALSAARGTVGELDGDSADYWPQVQARVRGYAAEAERIDKIVQDVSPRWKLARMARIDRNILRLGAWEIVCAKLPPIAVIDACVDLAKEYGDKGTGAFVNGLLDQICKDHGLKMR